jgi:RNA polymerase sigma-70 factor (ECF subfamily)
VSDPTSAPIDALQVDEVLDRFLVDLRRFVQRRVPESDADDVLQETLLRIDRGLPGLDDDARLPGWVHQVARSAIADHHRRLGRRRQTLLDDLGGRGVSRDLDHADVVPPSVVPDEPGVGETSASLAARCLEAMLDRLPPDQQDAVRQVDFLGMPQQELARRRGLSPSGARTRVQRGRQALRGMLTRCCHVALDRRGGVADLSPRRSDCC